MAIERPREITAEHLAGWAGVYVRQSTERQVEENKGSLEYQRGQARWPGSWGWPDEAIRFYEDRGLSGAAAEHRPAFMEMLADIQGRRLRAVFASDQSRLARNLIEWIHFLDLCRHNNVLLVLDGRIIHLGDDGDDFSSRVVALVDEFENRKRRATFRRGILGKIEAGRAATAPPTGYVSNGDGTWDLDPDKDVQTGIAEVFRVFLGERSCARTVRALRGLGQLIPRRRPGKPVRWVEPNLRAVLTILRNPAYSGAYVYRQRVVDESRGRDARGHSRVRVGRPEERIEIADHHPAYVTRETWSEVSAILRNNAPSKNRRNLGPGSALLQGILVCERHGGRSMPVSYAEKRRDGTNNHYYHCLGLYEVGGVQCGALPGRILDVAVARAVFRRLGTPSLETIRTEWRMAQNEQRQAGHARSVACDRAQRRVEDLRARYLAISPALRDLAEDIEAQLNDALGTLKRFQASPPERETALLSEGDFQELIELCQDLPGLFWAASTTHRDRKEIVRTFVERVSVAGRTPETISAIVHWADGSDPTPIESHLARYAQRRIEELAQQGLTNVQIADRLNERGLETSRGRRWSRATVWQVRQYGNRRAAQS